METTETALILPETPTLELVIRFLLNLTAIFIAVRLLYYPRHRNKDFVFTFFLFNCINFLICLLLGNTQLKVGFAFGLFAIFSILRYRTVTIPVKEMGYFFLAVALGMINALAPAQSFEIYAANGLLLGITYLLDGRLTLKHENHRAIIYERIELVHTGRMAELLEDLRNRTGLPVHRVEIIRIDLMRDTALLNAFYYAVENESASAELQSGGD